ncbi:hypothetical protein GALMADRAFT_390559 [Galerina marginata CBS 339.88]|uniref:F-box domain-containing protein n=1 Tax=Galerina marginata (strain CBS 339.88) TaxID=685588 RepID=A0A067TRQ8_GALM3|nr:hypothetical protein GALMADRAFT_390559 [Galerina marginata CBS 339.88]
MDDSSSLEREVKRLKRELRAMKMEKEDLMDEVTDLQHELDFCHQTLALRKPFSQPPPEILYMIFERAILPSFLVSSSDSFVPNSFWCKVQQQKYSIINVCRTWYTTGLPFLYANVFIRRVYQLSKLLKTLRLSSPNQNLKEMIKTIEFNCFVPVWYTGRYEQELTAIFNTCPSITSYTFGSQLSSFHLPLAAPFCAVVPKITDLCLHYDIDMRTLENIVELAPPHLVSLSFKVLQRHLDPGPPSCLFPRLDAITIWFSSPQVAPSLEAYVGVWKMPHLRRLTVKRRLPATTLELLCDAYGSNLQYLHLATHRDSWIRRTMDLDSKLPDLSHSCPPLKHIVLTPDYSKMFTHKGIEWVDVWAADETLSDVRTWRRDLIRRKSDLPRLKGVRILPYQLHELPLSLPLLFPPALVSTPEDSFAFHFSDVVIQHEVGELCYRQPDWVADLGEIGLSTPEDSSNDGYSSNESDSEDGSYSSDRSCNWEVGSDKGITKDWDTEMDALEHAVYT